MKHKNSEVKPILYYVSVTSVVKFCGRQQGVDFSKKSVKWKKKFDLTFPDVHMDRKKLGTILENRVVQKLKFSKNDNKKNLLNWYSSVKKKSERFKWFLTYKIDSESQI